MKPAADENDVAAEPRPSAPKKRLKGSERRAEYLKAAAGIIAQHGVSAVTMEEVAVRTNVDKRLGYKYFSNREHLLQDLFEQEMMEATSRATARISASDDLRETLLVYITVWLELNDEHGLLLSRLFSDQDVLPAVARGISDRAVRNWAGVMTEPLGLSPERATILSRIYLSGLRGAVESLTSGTIPLREIAELYATAIFAGAQAVADLPKTA
jgi:AcrR family transcriptional regulator